MMDGRRQLGSTCRPGAGAAIVSSRRPDADAATVSGLRSGAGAAIVSDCRPGADAATVSSDSPGNRFGGHRRGGVLSVAFVLALLLTAVFGNLALADEEYVVGPDDVLAVSVWDSPNLSRTVVVRANGTISLPPLGDVMAAGKTTTVLARDIEREIYNNLRRTSQVTITVVAFNAQKVYLAGEVAIPGRHSFEKLPDLMDLLAQAGGLGPTADLGAVRIVRREGDSQRTLDANISRAVESGNLSNLPRLQSGDLIIVPSTIGAGGGGAAVGSASAFVLGQVGRPGPLGVTAGMTLVQALAVAGGLAPDADWRNVEVIASDPVGGTYLVRVDLEREIQSGRGGPEIRPGDSIRVPVRDPNLAQVALGALRGTLEASRDVLNLLLVRDVLTNDNNN